MIINVIMFTLVKTMKLVNMKWAQVTTKTTIERVKSEMDLEVFIEEKLNFCEHITKKVNIAIKTSA